MKKIYIFFAVIFINTSLFSQTRTDSIHVVHYDINLSIIDFSGQTINGYTIIKAITRLDSISYLNIDLMNMQIDSMFINNLISNEYTYANNKIKIKLPENKTGDTIIFKIFYSGHPYTDVSMGGFYFVDKYAFNLGVGIHSIPHSLGSSWFPCIDEFTDKSTYTFHIRTPKEKMAVCGGLLIDSLYLTDSTRIWTWELNQAIPTYLASVAVSDYQVYRDTFQGINRIIPIEIYATPEKYQYISGSFSNLKNALRLFENKFGPYVWQRVGYVCIPFSGGAMEHSCNIAYPNFAVNGNIMYEFLLFHELSHSWFGNLITCSKPEEMWINEGFASFSEFIRLENLYSKFNYQKYKKSLTENVLLTAHKKDGDFYALNNVPLEATYGSTSYEKGAIVVNYLRNYMGDTLFFNGISSLLNNYAFSNVSSEILFSYLSQTSGMDLTGFYDAWINQPGFLHFSIDSIVAKGNNQYNVYIRQRLYHAQHFGNDNKIDLTFFSPTREIYTTNYKFSGEYGMANVTIPFKPDFGIIDYYEKMPDATIDSNLTLVSSGKTFCDNVDVSVNITSLQDSVFMQIENHLVSPDSVASANPKIYRFSNSHYWRVAYTTASNINGSLYFNYNIEMDSVLLSGCSKNDIILLYRPNSSEVWKIIPSTHRGTTAVGSLETVNILAGEYCLALGNDSDAMIKMPLNDIGINIFPNPTSDYVNITANEQGMNIQLFSIEGKKLISKTMTSSPTRLNLMNYPKGVYLLKIKQKKGPNSTVKIIKE